MFDRHYFARTPVAELYAWFATETAPTSPVWQAVCEWVVETPDVQRLLDTLPGTKRQPNLFLGALKYVDAPLEPGPRLLGWVQANWSRIEALILARATQTNEPGRCSVLAPVVAALDAEVALIEVGSSAGACLLLDHYRYRWHCGGDLVEAGTGPALDSTVVGDAAGPPLRVPRVGWRRGIDLNPLSATDEDDVRWLRALVWPGEEEREERLARCLEVVRRDPPVIVAGNALEVLPEVVEQVPDGLVPVVMHSAVLAYLTRPDRQRFVDLIGELGVHWVSMEGARVVPGVRDLLPGDPPPTAMAVALDGHPVAWAQHHGRWVQWL